MLLRYSLYEPCQGHNDIKEFMRGFRGPFPNLVYAGAPDLFAEGDFVIGRWTDDGAQIGSAFDDKVAGSRPETIGRTMRFTGTTVFRIENGKIAEEMDLDDGVTARTYLGFGFMDNGP